MFLGSYALKLDEKGRLILPAKFRDDLAEGIVMTKGQEHCLYVFKRPDFVAQAAALDSLPLTDKPAREYNRLFFANAHDDAPDKQRRITVPTELRTYAGLTKDCVVLGANTRLEIWDAAAWATYQAVKEPAYADQAG